MIRKILIIIVSALSIFSCSSDFLALGQKENVLPHVTAPMVKSFENETSIKVSWDLDKGADEYVLYRDEAADGSFSEAVYDGKDLSYVDTEITTEKFYYYKLSKKQGYKEFDKSKYVPGILSLARKDAYEDNDTKETAKPLDDYTLANIYYYFDKYGNAFDDKDWYYVDVEPWHILTIQVQQYKYGNVLADNDICFNLESGTPGGVTVNSPITITNNSQTVTQRYYFEMTVNKTQFQNTIKNYIIRIVSSEPLH
jgi:hypothetical protein